MNLRRRIQTINDTRIKYIKVLDKLYQVIKISYFNMTVAAKKTELSIPDVPQEEIFDLTELRDFKITLDNWKGRVIDMVEYLNRQKEKG